MSAVVAVTVGLVVLMVWAEAKAEARMVSGLGGCEGCAVGSSAREVRDMLVQEEQGTPKETTGDVTPSISDADHEEDKGVQEGRGRKLKKLLPFLLALKMQYAVYGVLAYLVVALIAKAALIKGSLALALSGVVLLWRLLSTHHIVARTQVKYHENSHTKTYIGGPQNGYQGDYVSNGGAGAGGGYGGDGHGHGGGWDSYAAVDQANQYSQHNPGAAVAYRGQKPMGR